MIQTAKRKQMGRPKKEIDYNLVYRMAKRFATQEDIAMICQCSASKLQHDKKFLQAFNKGKSQVFKNLRVAQYRYAMQGNAQLLIWLGKNYLGQRDIKEEENQNYDVIDFKFEIVSAEDKTDN